jgi:hypothetical protein
MGVFSSEDGAAAHIRCGAAACFERNFRQARAGEASGEPFHFGYSRREKIRFG